MTKKGESVFGSLYPENDSLVRHGRACLGHPRLSCCRCHKTCWGGRPPHGIECAKLAFANKRRRPSMNEIIRIGIDLSKRVFQVHGVNGVEQTVLRRTLRRDQMERFFAALPATLIGMEA